MKVAILSESPADETAVRILVDAILGQATERAPSYPRPAPGGWPAVLNLIDGTVRYLYYQTDVEGLVVVADSDHPTLHDSKIAVPCSGSCRICQLRVAIQHTTGHLTPVAAKPALRTAIGLGVPAIEAWYRCLEDHRVTEMAWCAFLGGQPCGYDKVKLKHAVYGRRGVSPIQKIEIVRNAAKRLSGDQLRLAAAFPVGFGILRNDLESWKA